MKILATLLLFLFFSLPASAKIIDPFNFPWISKNFLPGVMVVHSDIEGVDTADLRMCFMVNAHEREGASVRELFLMALPPGWRDGGVEIRLVLALLDLNTLRWAFFYVAGDPALR